MTRVTSGARPRRCCKRRWTQRRRRFIACGGRIEKGEKENEARREKGIEIERERERGGVEAKENKSSCVNVLREIIGGDLTFSVDLDIPRRSPRKLPLGAARFGTEYANTVRYRQAQLCYQRNAATASTDDDAPPISSTHCHPSSSLSASSPSATLDTIRPDYTRTVRLQRFRLPPRVVFGALPIPFCSSERYIRDITTCSKNKILSRYR